jgi:hypothetical protein
MAWPAPVHDAPNLDFLSRILVKICVDHRDLRVCAFRALGTVCCVLEGIMELEEAGGIQVTISFISGLEKKFLGK